MNSKWKLGVAFALGVVVTTAARLPFSNPALAADGRPGATQPVKGVATGPAPDVEHYKVINFADSGPNEQQLNQLGAEGWKVRTGAGAAWVILAR